MYLPKSGNSSLPSSLSERSFHGTVCPLVRSTDGCLASSIGNIWHLSHTGKTRTCHRTPALSFHTMCECHRTPALSFHTMCEALAFNTASHLENNTSSFPKASACLNPLVELAPAGTYPFTRRVQIQTSSFIF